MGRSRFTRHSARLSPICGVNAKHIHFMHECAHTQTQHCVSLPAVVTTEDGNFWKWRESGGCVTRLGPVVIQLGHNGLSNLTQEKQVGDNSHL